MTFQIIMKMLKIIFEGFFKIIALGKPRYSFYKLRSIKLYFNIRNKIYSHFYVNEFETIELARVVDHSFFPLKTH